MSTMRSIISISSMCFSSSSSVLPVLCVLFVLLVVTIVLCFLLDLPFPFYLCSYFSLFCALHFLHLLKLFFSFTCSISSTFAINETLTTNRTFRKVRTNRINKAIRTNRLRRALLLPVVNLFVLCVSLALLIL